jgi:hypothetical protein
MAEEPIKLKTGTAFPMIPPQFPQAWSQAHKNEVTNSYKQRVRQFLGTPVPQSQWQPDWRGQYPEAVFNTGTPEQPNYWFYRHGPNWTYQRMNPGEREYSPPQDLPNGDELRALRARISDNAENPYTHQPWVQGKDVSQMTIGEMREAEAILNAHKNFKGAETIPGGTADLENTDRLLTDYQHIRSVLAKMDPGTITGIAQHWRDITGSMGDLNKWGITAHDLANFNDLKTALFRASRDGGQLAGAGKEGTSILPGIAKTLSGALGLGGTAGEFAGFEGAGQVIDAIANGTINPELLRTDVPKALNQLRLAGFNRAYHIAQENYDLPQDLRNAAQKWGHDAANESIGWNGDYQLSPPIEIGKDVSKFITPAPSGSATPDATPSPTPEATRSTKPGWDWKKFFSPLYPSQRLAEPPAAAASPTPSPESTPTPTPGATPTPSPSPVPLLQRNITEIPGMFGGVGQWIQKHVIEGEPSKPPWERQPSPAPVSSASPAPIYQSDFPLNFGGGWGTPQNPHTVAMPPTPGSAAAGARGLPVLASNEEYDKLSPGDQFVWHHDGNAYVKT